MIGMSKEFPTKCLACEQELHMFEEIEAHNKQKHTPEPWLGFDIGRPKPVEGKESSEGPCDVCGKITSYMYWRREPRITENMAYCCPDEYIKILNPKKGLAFYIKGVYIEHKIV